MLNCAVTAAFENMKETDQVGIGVIMRRCSTNVGHRLVPEMDDALRAIIGEQLFNR